MIVPLWRRGRNHLFEPVANLVFDADRVTMRTADDESWENTQ
jgi:hypothetical protein